MKGGFNNSNDIWSFGMCKTLIDAIGGAPAGTKKNWRECLIWMASRASVTPEDLFNKMTPDEFLKKVGMSHVLGANYYGLYKQPYAKFQDSWSTAKRNRDEALAKGEQWGASWKLGLAPLPGKEATVEQKEAAAAAKETAEMHKFFKEPSEFEGDPWYESRVRELEDGASIVASEECYGHGSGSADPGLCLAAHKGTAKRIARRERQMKERARRQALNAVAGDEWANAQGPLLALAAQHANRQGNFNAVYNGVPVEEVPLKKGQVQQALFKPGTGTWLTGRDIPASWPVSAQEKAWEGKPGPNFYQQKRGATWQPPPQQNGDYLKADAIKEIMEQTYDNFPVSGPNKKLPERALYDQIVDGLRMVTYEKGYEDPLTHQPRLDVYDQALSRAMNWRRKGAVSL
jgi:hypothetical protein